MNFLAARSLFTTQTGGKAATATLASEIKIG